MKKPDAKDKPATSPGLKKMQAQRDIEKGKPEKGEEVAREVAAGEMDEAKDRTGRYR